MKHAKLKSINSYWSAQTALGTKEQVKVAANTWLYKDYADRYKIKYYDTVILVFHPDGTKEVNLNGYNTVTTRERLNTMLHTNKIFTTKGVPFMTQPGSLRPIEFRDGMIFNNEGKCLNYWENETK